MITDRYRTHTSQVPNVKPNTHKISKIQSKNISADLLLKNLISRNVRMKITITTTEWRWKLHFLHSIHAMYLNADST